MPDHDYDPRHKRERRQTPRFKVVGEIGARLVSNDTPVLVLDISTAGLALQSSVDFDPGLAYELELTADGQPPVVVRAVNVHCLHALDELTPCYVAGFAFLGNAHRIRVDTIVRELAHRREPAPVGR